MLNQFNLDMVGTLRVPSIKQCQPFGCQKNCPLEWGFPPKIQTTPTVLAFWRALNTWFIAQTNDIPFFLSALFWVYFVVVYCSFLCCFILVLLFLNFLGIVNQPELLVGWHIKLIIIHMICQWWCLWNGTKVSWQGKRDMRFGQGRWAERLEKE